MGAWPYGGGMGGRVWGRYGGGMEGRYGRGAGYGGQGMGVRVWEGGRVGGQVRVGGPSMRPMPYTMTPFDML